MEEEYDRKVDNFNKNMMSRIEKFSESDNK